MDEPEISGRQSPQEIRLSAARLLVAFVGITAGVCWCAYLTWREGTPPPPDSNAMEFVVMLDPALSNWFPVVASIVSLALATVQIIRRTNPNRLLIVAASLVVVQALGLGIEALMP